MAETERCEKRSIKYPAKWSTIIVLGLGIAILVGIAFVRGWQTRGRPRRQASVLLTDNHEALVSMIDEFRHSEIKVLTRDHEGLLVDGKRITCGTNKCEVVDGKRLLASASSMKEALSVVAKDPDEVAALVNRMQGFGITYIAWIGYTRPESERYIQMLFDSNTPVGLLFVPDEATVAMRDLTEESHLKEANYPYVSVEHLQGHWFYFRGRT